MHVNAGVAVLIRQTREKGLALLSMSFVVLGKTEGWSRSLEADTVASIPRLVVEI